MTGEPGERGECVSEHEGDTTFHEWEKGRKEQKQARV